MLSNESPASLPPQFSDVLWATPLPQIPSIDPIKWTSLVRPAGAKPPALHVARITWKLLGGSLFALGKALGRAFAFFGLDAAKKSPKFQNNQKPLRPPRRTSQLRSSLEAFDFHKSEERAAHGP